MIDIFKKIIFFLLNKTRRCEKKINYISSSAIGKTIITAYENMELNFSYDKQVDNAEAEIENLIRTNFDKLEALYSYIRTSGTRIYEINLAKPILNYFKIQMGYIPLITGIKAGVLNLILNKRVSFELSDVFLIPASNLKPNTFFYKFYMWYFYKNNILYIDEKIATLLFELDNENKQEKIPSLTYHESNIISKIVKADMRAIKFVMSIVESITKAKKLAKNIKAD